MLFRSKPDDEGITDSKKKELLRVVRAPGSWRARIDITRLLIQWAIVAAGVFVGYASCAPRQTKA